MLDLQSLIHEIETAIAIVSEEGEFFYVNKAYAGLFGYEPYELEGQKYFILMDDISAKLFKTHLEKVFRDEYYFESFRTQLLHLISKDKNVVSIKARARTFVANYKTKYRVIIAHKNDEAYRDDALIQKQKLESLGRLAGGVAHEINNLLQPILLYTDIIKDNLDEEEHQDATRGLNMIKESALGARQIVEDVLVFTRDGKPRTELLSLSSTVQQSLVFLKGVLPATVTLDTSTLDDFAGQQSFANSDQVYIDKNAMTQILVNLINNAMHAMETKKDGVIRISMHKERIGSVHAKEMSINPGLFANLQFSDNGHGIAREAQDSIFEPFYTTKKVGEGTGLGLSVVYGIIKGWGGSIMVDSTLGEGATFNIYIPIEIDI